MIRLSQLLAPSEVFGNLIRMMLDRTLGVSDNRWMPLGHKADGGILDQRIDMAAINAWRIAS